MAFVDKVFMKTANRMYKGTEIAFFTAFIDNYKTLLNTDIKMKKHKSKRWLKNLKTFSRSRSACVNSGLQLRESILSTRL